MSVPPLGILCALPRRFSTASCPPLSPPTKEKDAERGWSRWKGVGGRVGGRGGYGWRGWVKVMLGWCEGGTRLECGECDQKLIPNKRIHLLYLFTSFAWSTAWDSVLPFPLLRSFFSSLPLSTLLHFHLRTLIPLLERMLPFFFSSASPPPPPLPLH